MILSGIMIRMGLTEGFSALLYPLLHAILRIRKNVCYAIIMGFLCGFPMGAKVTADLLERDMITREEASYLLAFCNNIGPVYFCSFVLPMLGRQLVLPYLLGMYGIPFLYGMILRYTLFRNLGKTPQPQLQAAQIYKTPPQTSFLVQSDDAIRSAVQSILSLGGYMILFAIMNLIPIILLGSQSPWIKYIAPLLEINQGLALLGAAMPLYSLMLLPFGGMSCIAQTYSMIKNTNLPISSYVIHKLILTLLTAGYYLTWFYLSPLTFMN